MTLPACCIASSCCAGGPELLIRSAFRACAVCYGGLHTRSAARGGTARGEGFHICSAAGACAGTRAGASACTATGVRARSGAVGQHLPFLGARRRVLPPGSHPPCPLDGALPPAASRLTVTLHAPQCPLLDTAAALANRAPVVAAAAAPLAGDRAPVTATLHAAFAGNRAPLTTAQVAPSAVWWAAIAAAHSTGWRPALAGHPVSRSLC